MADDVGTGTPIKRPYRKARPHHDFDSIRDDVQILESSRVVGLSKVHSEANAVFPNEAHPHTQ